jgi:hypothetical protein
MKKLVLKMGVGLLAALSAISASGQTITAPPQPTSGPGSNQYIYGVLQSGPFVVSGQGKKTGYAYYTYTPVGLPPSKTNPNPLPTPKTAPVVLFLSAEDSGATANTDYLFLLEQMTTMGYSVIFPNYTSKEMQKDYATVVLADLKDALNTLTTNTTLVPPTLDSNGKALYTVVGHSQGAYLALTLASTAVANGLPVPKAVVSIEAHQGNLAKLNALAIDPSTLVILVVADQDKSNRICPSVAIWNQMTQIPNVYKPFLYVRSDSYGTPAQLGNHVFPLTFTKSDTDPPPNAVDDRDWNITYKLSVAATACTINGQYCDYAIGNGPPDINGVTTQTDMGRWSDGTLVLPLVYEINPVNAFATLNCKLN